MLTSAERLRVSRFGLRLALVLTAFAAVACLVVCDSLLLPLPPHLLSSHPRHYLNIVYAGPEPWFTNSSIAKLRVSPDSLAGSREILQGPIVEAEIWRNAAPIHDYSDLVGNISQAPPFPANVNGDISIDTTHRIPF